MQAPVDTIQAIALNSTHRKATAEHLLIIELASQRIEVVSAKAS
jgi:hypothetical protein